MEKDCWCNSLVNAMDMQLECAKILHESLLVPALMYSSETMIWNEKERFRIKAVQMENFRGLLGIRRMNSPECTDRRVVRGDERSR